MNVEIKLWVFLLLIPLALSSCSSSIEQKNSAQNRVESKYPRMIGDIEPDSLRDDPDFQLCENENTLVQYYALGEQTYQGEKWAIEKIVAEHYQLEEMAGETGLIRIRFVVNCEGKTGRFRLLTMSPDYSERKFDAAITDRLLAITKSLDSWKTFKRKSGKPLEYYQYLIFKLKDGQVIEILP